MENEIELLGEGGIAALLKAGRLITQREACKSPWDKEGKPYIVLQDHDGTEYIEYIDGRVERPPRIHGTVELEDVESFLHYYETYKTGASLVYAKLDPVTFTAVFNEHAGGEKRQPDWRDHRAELTLKFSEEWTAWMDRNGSHKTFAGGVDFAEWLEDRLPDVVEPTNGSLYEVALSIKITSNIAYSQAARLSDGRIQLNYQDNVEGSAGKNGELAIPEKFAIEIPLFKGLNQKKYRITARFRYRLVGGRLSIWYELERPNKVLEQAFDDAWQQIKEKTKVILLGTPG